MAVVLLAAVLRFYGLGSLSFYYDEADNALVARTYLDTGRFQLPSGFFAPNGMTYKWTTAQLFRFFGESEWVARLPSALFGVLTTILIYLWGLRWFGPGVGGVSAFLFAIWPWSVTWGRVGRFYGLQQFLFFLLVVAVWRLLEKDCCRSTPGMDSDREPPQHWSWRKEIFALVPVVLLSALSLLTSMTTIHALTFFPLYLLSRLIWCRCAEDGSAFEFRRTMAYIGVCLLLVLLVIVGLLTYASDLVRGILTGTRGNPIIPLFYLSFLRANFGLSFVLCLFVGAAVAFIRGRPGLMVVAATLGPILAHTFAVPHYRDRFIYYVFPFLLYLVSLPIGWSVDRMARFFRDRDLACPFGNVSLAVSIVILALMIRSCVQNVFLAQRSTASIVSGSPYTLAREVADFRGAAKSVLPLGPDVRVVTTDAVLAHYYLGRADILYPFILPTHESFHYNMRIACLPSGDGLFEYLARAEETVIIGTRRKFESTTATPEGAALWMKLLSEGEVVWDGELEVCIRWREPVSNPGGESPRHTRKSD
jgi:hypothetical protein